MIPLILLYMNKLSVPQSIQLSWRHYGCCFYDGKPVAPQPLQPAAETLHDAERDSLRLLAVCAGDELGLSSGQLDRHNLLFLSSGATDDGNNVIGAAQNDLWTPQPRRQTAP